MERELDKKEKMIGNQKSVMDRLKIKVVELEQANEGLLSRLRQVNHQCSSMAEKVEVE